MCNMCSTADSLLIISDSIAIEILDQNAVLAAVGNELHLHQNKNETKVLDARLRNKVHGIVKGNGVNANKLLIYGEKEFLILEVNDEYRFAERYRGKLSDWISTGIFLETEPAFVLLTAHSVLLEFIENENMSDYTLTKRVSCEDKSTLYCGHLSGRCWRDLVVFGGNAFGELLIWQPKSVENVLTKATLLQRIAAHNGVIFSIDYDCEKQLLISTSDDRSVQFWKVTNTQDWSTAYIKPIASGYGHMARVFQGKIIQYEKSSFALTVGEDSYFCLWRCDGELLFKQRHQFGAVIWRLAYDAEQQLIYTVGSTGNLLTFNLKAVLSKSEPQFQKVLILSETDTREYLAKVKFLTKTELIGITNRNQLMLYDLNSDKWKSIHSAVDFKCTVLEVSEKLVAVCGFKCVFVYEFDGGEMNRVWQAEVLSSVIRSFHFLSDTKFLISDDRGNCVLMNFDKKTKQEIAHVIDLPQCKERWLTAATLVGEQFLLASNRQGNLVLYAFETESNTFELKHILKHPHGYLGATLLKLIALEENCAYVQSAGHDNTLKTLKVDLNGGIVSVQSQMHTPIAWIEASIGHLTSWQTYLGFNDNHFVVWSSEYDTSLQVACGGGHRCWHFYSFEAEDSEKQNRIRLAFIKNKKVLLFDYPMRNESKMKITLPLRNRWHTRPCNTLKVIKNEVADESIIISAGDDNLIKITTLKVAQCKAITTQHSEIQTHISNIRALKVLRLSPTKCLIFSGGGRAQLCLTELDLANYRVSEILNFTLKTDDTLETLNKQAHSFNPETRIMSIDVLQQETVDQNQVEHLKIYTGCSDGYIRIYKMEKAAIGKESAELELEQTIFYGKCLLQVKLVNNSFLITAATDGYVTFFDLSLTQILLKLPLHSSGINALDVHYNCKTKLLRLLTGGDDQSVVFTKICFKNPTSPMLEEKLELPQLHTAQVTAAKLIGDGLYSYTSGVDQNLVHFDLEAKSVVSVTHGCIADVKGLEFTENENVCLIYGCGLQVFKTKS